MADGGILDVNALGTLPGVYEGAASQAALRNAAPARVRDATKALRSSDENELCALPGVFLGVHTDLEALQTEWRTFEAEAECTAFQRYDWVSKWQRHIGAHYATKPAIVLGRDTDGRLLFIFPLAVETEWFTRRLTWLASRLCDYNGPLLAPEIFARLDADRFMALWDEILALIGADPKLRFDLVDLTKMAETIGNEPNPFMALNPVPASSSAYVANLGTDWDAFYKARRSGATRKRERRQFQHLAEFGDVQFVEPAERRDIERTLEVLFAQKADSFARMGVENFLLRPGHHAFFNDLATDSAASMTHVSRLDVGETWAATNFGLEFRGRYYLLLSSYEDGALSRHGPGRAHLQALIRRAMEKGLTQFDFTIGDEPYKRDWSDVTVRLYGHFAATRLRGLPVVLAVAAFRRAKRTIKQNPLLWRLFSEARERIRRVPRR